MFIRPPLAGEDRSEGLDLIAFILTFSSHREKESRHLCQQSPESLHRLPHMKTFLYRPYARRHRMNDRYLQVFLEQMNNIKAAPAGAEHVDAVGAGIF